MKQLASNRSFAGDQRIDGSSFMCCGSFYWSCEVVMPPGLLSFKITWSSTLQRLGNLTIPFAKLFPLSGLLHLKCKSFLIHINLTSKHLMCLDVRCVCVCVFDFDWMLLLLFDFPKWFLLVSWVPRLAALTPRLPLLWSFGRGWRWPASVIVDLSWHLARCTNSYFLLSYVVFSCCPSLILYS